MNAIQGIIKKEEYGFTRLVPKGSEARKLWEMERILSSQLDSCLHNMCTARSTCYLLF